MSDRRPIAGPRTGASACGARSSGGLLVGLLLAPLLALLLSAVGCSPTINASEGFYSCTDGGGCPDGQTCRRDGRCHAGTASLDAPCDEDDPGGTFCLAGLHCLEGNGGVGGLESTHYCGTLCPGGDGDCGEGYQCFGGECVIRCEDRDDCQVGNCRRPQLPMSASERLDAPICIELDERGYEGRRSCTFGDASCAPPGFCLTASEGGAHCGLRCEANSQCGMGGQCLRLGGPTELGHCFLPCGGDGDCGSEGFTCETTGLAGPGGAVCMPTAWADRLGELSFNIGPPPMR